MAASGMKAVPLPSSLGVGPDGVATSASRLARAVRGLSVAFECGAFVVGEVELLKLDHRRER